MSIIRNAARAITRPVRRWFLAFSCLLTGQQHSLIIYLWSVMKKAARDKEFNAVGFQKFRLMSPAEWEEFGSVVRKQVELAGEQHRSRVDWADDQRIYIDCSQQPVSGLLQRIYDSESFRTNLDRIFGKSRWGIVNAQIWRNQPAKYQSSEKEINSTYYHLDNGGHFDDRLLLNVFMYLSDVTRENGPFIYFDRKETEKINRHFIGHVFRLGNLRTYPLVTEIERFATPQELSLQAGEVAVIDNQVCLHRAGFCAAGTRDMLQILLRG